MFKKNKAADIMVSSALLKITSTFVVYSFNLPYLIMNNTISVIDNFNRISFLAKGNLYSDTFLSISGD